jgi:hypothetical protein
MDPRGRPAVKRQRAFHPRLLLLGAAYLPIPDWIATASAALAAASAFLLARKISMTVAKVVHKPLIGHNTVG